MPWPISWPSTGNPPQAWGRARCGGLSGQPPAPHLALPLPHSVELEEPPRVRTAARLFQQSCYRYREELSAGIIVAGWDPRRGGQVGSLQSWCPLFLSWSTSPFCPGILFSTLECSLFCPGMSLFLPECPLVCPGLSHSDSHLLLSPGILFSAPQHSPLP